MDNNFEDNVRKTTHEARTFITPCYRVQANTKQLYNCITSRRECHQPYTSGKVESKRLLQRIDDNDIFLQSYFFTIQAFDSTKGFTNINFNKVFRFRKNWK